MIQVNCRCGKAFSVADEHAGRMGRCSACGRQVQIPKKQGDSPRAEMELSLVDEKADLKAQRQQEYDALKDAIAGDPTNPQPHVQLADLCNEIGQKQEALEHYRTAYILDSSLKHVLDKIGAIGGPIERTKLEAEEKAEASADEFWRMLPRAFIYPFSGTGAFIVVGGALFFWLFSLLFHMPRIGLRGAVLVAVVGVGMAGYMVSYAFDAIGDVANGKVEPPDWPDLSEVAESFVNVTLVVVCILAAGLPAGVYALITRDWGWVFGVCVGVGLFYFPMCLLAVAILRSPLAVLPHLIFPPIWRTRVRYVATVAVAFVACLLAQITRTWGYIPVLSQFLMVYILLVQMYAIGVFYRTNEARIGWLVEETE